MNVIIVVIMIIQAAEWVRPTYLEAVRVMARSVRRMEANANDTHNANTYECKY